MAMPDANVWEDRYQRGENQWEKGAPHPALAAYLRDHAMPGRVLVPGCGFGHDVRLLADAGAEALGLDIAPSAVSHAQALGANVRLGDFFHLDPALCGSFDGVFEHTCFCAIDRDRRDGYVEAAAKALKPGGRLLAIFYLRPWDPGEDQNQGPPHGCTVEELHDRFGGTFEFQREWVPEATYPGREGKEWMAELVLR